MALTVSLNKKKQNVAITHGKHRQASRTSWCWTLHPRHGTEGTQALGGAWAEAVLHAVPDLSILKDLQAKPFTSDVNGYEWGYNML